MCYAFPAADTVEVPVAQTAGQKCGMECCELNQLVIRSTAKLRTSCIAASSLSRPLV